MKTSDDWAFMLQPLALAALLLLATISAFAAETAGVILALTGQVEVVRDGKTLSATRTTALFSGDAIVTGDGQAQIRFADGTMLTLYRDTRFAVNDYRYGNGNGDHAQFSLVSGLMHTLTGKIDKKSYQVKTRLANLGVRGTEYSVSLDDALHVSVDSGCVSIANEAGTLLVNAGDNAVVTGTNVMPRPAGGRIVLPGGPGGGPGGPGGPGAGPGGGPGGAGGGAPPPPPPGTRRF